MTLDMDSCIGGWSLNHERQLVGKLPVAFQSFNLDTQIRLCDNIWKITMRYLDSGVSKADWNVVCDTAQWLQSNYLTLVQ